MAATIANTTRDPKKRATPFRPEDFMPIYGPIDVEARQKRLKAKILELHSIYGGKLTES